MSAHKEHKCGGRVGKNCTMALLNWQRFISPKATVGGVAATADGA
jgi:hypothetical protein